MLFSVLNTGSVAIAREGIVGVLATVLQLKIGHYFITHILADSFAGINFLMLAKIHQNSLREDILQKYC